MVGERIKEQMERRRIITVKISLFLNKNALWKDCFDPLFSKRKWVEGTEKHPCYDFTNFPFPTFTTYLLCNEGLCSCLLVLPSHTGTVESTQTNVTPHKISMQTILKMKRNSWIGRIKHTLISHIQVLKVLAIFLDGPKFPMTHTTSWASFAGWKINFSCAISHISYPLRL